MVADPVRASTRVSIAWSGAPAQEDTDTLVLTINGYSLDLRVVLPGHAGAGTLDWGTVGLVVELEGSTPDKPLLRWDNILDSHPAPPADLEPLDDVGSFSALPNGDVLETGAMFNPKTARNEPYDEVWRRLPVPAGAAYFVLERADGRAFVGRVGALALGAWSEGAQYAAWRDELDGSAWRRVYAFGEAGNVPAAPVEVPAEWRKDAVVTLGEHTWTVRTVGTV
ncbi:hypothetical protein Q8F55_001812 [Vanrija albida]|uniref:Protein HRI1 n=1 Tax=Vanrija albida TaxID=181172 RepID=A0ABR3Q813_9TREE